MQMPPMLQAAVEEMAESVPTNVLRAAHTQLSEAYRRGDDSSALFQSREHGIAYLLARMPATYAAVYRALASMKERLPEWFCKTVLDIGAGPGTASWAASEIFPDLERVVLFEKSAQIISMGRQLGLKSSEWIEQDLTRPFDLPKADLAILSYVHAEIDCSELIRKIWEQGVALLIVEPGTPKGFANILSLRKMLIEWGAQIVAPCPHQKDCPISGWCHFPARVERTKIHKMMKEGALGYEDEKFSYLAVAPGALLPIEGRVIKKPLKLSGHVKLSLCTKEGAVEERTITRKQKDCYRSARDAEWSSLWM